MSSGADFFLRKTLGEDFLESLTKTELWKPGTRSVTDVDDIHLGLKIVPRTIMSLLIRELGSMSEGEHKNIDLPLEGNCKLKIDKHGPDVFSGEVEKDNKKITEFKFRPIPGVGLVLMSAFELYDTNQLEEKSGHGKEIENKVQKMIDERLALHDLISKVVDKKIAERDAIQQLILAKLSEKVNQKEDKPETIKISGLTESKNNIQKNEDKPIKKKLPLNEFLDKRKEKKSKNEHPISLMKGESVSCPDCGKNIFDGQIFAGCICLGDDRDKKLYIKKSEKGVTIRFGKSWDPENIEMLLEVLRGKRG